MLQKLSNHINIHGNLSILRPFDNLDIPFLYKFGNCLFEKEWVYSMSLNFRSSSSFMRQKNTLELSLMFP